MKTLEQIQREYQQQQLLKQQQKAPHSNKQFESDTEDNDGMKSGGYQSSGSKKNDLDFNNILKQWGVTDLNKLIGATSESENEKSRKKRNQQNQAKLQEEEKKEISQQEKSAQQRVGLIQSIMEENRKARQDNNGKSQSPFDMMFSSIQEASTITKTATTTQSAQAESIHIQISSTKQYQVHQSEEDSDVAPMSSIVDLPSEEEVKQKEKSQIQKALKMASSASEDESTANEKGFNARRSNKQVAQQKDLKKVQSESEPEQIDTSIKSPQQQKTKKTVTYKGIKIQSDDEDYEQDKDQEQVKRPKQDEQKGKKQIVSRAIVRSDSEVSSSQDSAEEYFNQQRKMIKNKIIGNKDIQREFDKEDVASVGDQDAEDDYGNERQWDDDMQDFDNLMEQSMSEAKRIQEEEERKAREEQERIRLERLRQQEELIKQDQEKKRKERDELMEKLKKQDEERKKRKKEEKERKEREKEAYRRAEEERKQREQEEKEREMEKQKKIQDEQNRQKRQKEESERRKENFEKSIRKIWNGSDIPCLFDSKIAYSQLLYSLPVDLEQRIMNNEVSYEDLKFRRYKNLIIPIDGLLSQTSERSLIEIIDYFLRNSTIKHIDNNLENGSKVNQSQFPFKCIGLVQTVALPPFNQCSLSPVQPSDPNSYRVLSLLFDTHDNPRTKNNFNETLKNVKLTSILSQQSLSEIKAAFPQHLEALAQQYFYANKIKDFPYQVKVDKFPILEFTNPDKDLNFDDSESSQETLGRITFFMEYSVQDDIVPISTKESWEFIRRYPTFYAYNPNPKNFSKIDNRDKIQTRYNQYKYENVCVIFKELQKGTVAGSGAGDFTQQTKCNSSLEYFLKKALLKQGLEVCGARMIYLDSQQTQIYEHLFNEKLQSQAENHQKNGLLALFIRGVEAISKCEKIIGHFNPQSARATNEKSLRAFFGKDKDHNCSLKMFASQKKNLSELIFWFGGRVQQEVQPHQILEQQKQIVPISTMYLVVPPRIQKQYLFLSPLVTARDLPRVIQILSNDYGISILDIQKINYQKMQYESESISHFNRNLCFFKVRGNTYNIEIGFVMKLARENLTSKLKVALKKINAQLQHIPKTYGDLLYITSNAKEYKILKQKLKQTQFNVYYQHYQQEYSKTSSRVLTDYDTEDPENYKEIKLFNNSTSTSGLTNAGTSSHGLNRNIQQTKSKGSSSLNAQVQNGQDSFQTTSFLCFIKLSLLKKQIMNEVLQIITQQCGFEIIGAKIVNTKKHIYNELVPKDVRHTFKSIAFKFYEIYPELRLRKKICEFKSLVLVLRGRHVDLTLSKIYDLEKLKFIQDLGIYDHTPQVLFLTNQQVLDPVFDFLFATKLIKLYNDFSYSYEHLMDSPIYSYLLNHNVEKLDPVLAHQALAKNPDEKIDEVMSVQNIVFIKNKEHLIESQNIGSAKLSACVCVVKPNQPLNVALRTLKSIANTKELGLFIQNIELTKYNEQQLELLLKHDILFDENITEQFKEKFKNQYLSLFENSKNPVIQFLVSGPYAITKMQQLIGHRDPKLAAKDSLRSFYGVDRVDNAYFISENFSESLIERDYLFSNDQNTYLLESSHAQRTIKPLNQSQVVSQTQPNQSLLISHHQEVALVLISPTLVQSNDFVFVLDDLVRSKFNLCGLLRVKLEKEDVDALFTDLAPRFYNLEILNQEEFVKGYSVMAVFEKEKAVNEIQEVVGRFEIKSKNDFEKTKKKQTTTVYNMFNYGNDPQTLIQEYGSYIYTFPNVNLNQKKILRFFKELPNSQHFTIVQQNEQ